ncbi:MAG: ElyC/SanA/YdcF family protein [Sulfurovum sp.]|nr:ElyC/SanA/YdcF family protein [Sulfurovum sp.]
MIRWIAVAFIVSIAGIISIDMTMTQQTSAFIYTDLRKLPSKKTALLLGTTKSIAKDKKNYFYIYRIRAAAALFKAGKVKTILVSGDNGSQHSNETAAMQKDLIDAGVPEKHIVVDNAGFRTFDSITRAKEVFKTEDYIIVSQKFHLERALFIARKKKQKAIGFAAKDIEGTKAAYKMRLREYLARTKAFLDIYLLNPRLSSQSVQQ